LRSVDTSYNQAGIELANRVEGEIYRAFETLSQNPRLGHKGSDLTSHPGLLFAPTYAS
jgi:plasmid stabilization system protein ParE